MFEPAAPPAVGPAPDATASPVIDPASDVAAPSVSPQPVLVSHDVLERAS